MKYKIVIIGGNGVWGQNYVKTISNISNIDLTIANRNNWKKLIDDADGVIISTPPNSHIEIAKYILDKSIPVIIEKPISLSYQEAKILKQYNVPIIVNNIHLFSDAYQKIKDMSSKYNIKHIYSEGMNNGPKRDYSSLFDYAPHDLSMILDLLNEYPKKIDINETPTQYGKLYTIDLNFQNISTMSIVGNGAHKKVRHFNVELENGINIIYDEIEKQNSLANVINIFINAIRGKYDYRLGVDISLNILKILETYGDKAFQPT